MESDTQFMLGAFDNLTNPHEGCIMQKTPNGEFEPTTNTRKTDGMVCQSDRCAGFSCSGVHLRAEAILKVIDLALMSRYLSSCEFVCTPIWVNARASTKFLGPVGRWDLVW